MSFLDHLEELRWRLVKMVIAVFIFATVIFIFTEWITNNIFLILADTDFPIFKLFCNLNGFKSLLKLIVIYPVGSQPVSDSLMSFIGEKAKEPIDNYNQKRIKSTIENYFA